MGTVGLADIGPFAEALAGLGLQAVAVAPQRDVAGLAGEHVAAPVEHLLGAGRARRVAQLLPGSVHEASAGRIVGRQLLRLGGGGGGLDLRRRGGAFVGQVDFTYRSKIYFDTANTARLSDPARTFVNAQLGWRLDQGRYEVGLWGRNLFDETNISDITPLPSLGFDVISVGQPRTYGVYLRARY